MSMQDQSFLIPDLHAAYRAGLDPADVVAESFRRIDAVGDPGIFLHLIDRATVMAQAAALGPFDPVAKPLWGIPFAIKDNIDAADAPTTAACPDYAYDAEVDAFVVATLRAAGAMLVGKTNLDQFATGLVGMRTPYPIPRNALDPAIVPGGSSSGSAVAVAHGIVSFALGTDTAGSGRVPAALNGIVGLKPSLGALSTTGIVPACRTLDTVSIFALSVGDAYTVLRTAAVFDAGDAFARRTPIPPMGTVPARFRVGVPDAASREFFGDAVQADSFEHAIGVIETFGGELVEIDFTPFLQAASMLYNGAWVAERYSVVADLLERNPDALHPVTRRIVMGAAGMSGVDVFRDLYRMQEIRSRVAPVIASVDLFCVPTIPTFYTVEDLEADPIGPNSALGTYTNFVNLMDLCGIAVPTAPRADGRPGSVTLLAPAHQDARIAALADRLHRDASPQLGATGWRLPDVSADMPGAFADEIAIAVVGAHLSGMPLNAQLTDLGARFLREAKTAAQYRLYRLAGPPPLRPGLLRCAGGEAIALEIWALPLERFGAFMTGIPAPLGIGTVMLEDGSSVNGFICEACGLLGAEDITAYGGWRPYFASQSTQPATEEHQHA